MTPSLQPKDRPRGQYFELLLVGYFRTSNWKTRRFTIRNGDKFEALGRMFAYANKLLSGNHISIERYEELYGTVQEAYDDEANFILQRTGVDPRL
jgi:hypothetical protein